MYIKSRESSPNIQKNIKEQNIVYISPNKINKNISYKQKDNISNNINITQTPNKNISFDLFKTSNKKEKKRKPRYLIIRKELTNSCDLDNEYNVPNCDIIINSIQNNEIQKTHSYNLATNRNILQFQKNFKNRKKFVNFPISNKNSEIIRNKCELYPDIDFYETYENNNDYNFQNHYDRYQTSNNNYYNKNPIIFNNKTDINASKSQKHKINLIKHSSDNLFDNLNINFDNSKSEIKRKKKRVIYDENNSFFSHQKNLSFDSMKGISKNIRKENLKNKFENFMIKENKSSRFNSNIILDNNMCKKIVKRKRNTSFKINNTEYNISYDENLNINNKIDIKSKNRKRIEKKKFMRIKYTDYNNNKGKIIHSPEPKLIKTILNENFNDKMKKINSNKVNFKKIDLMGIKNLKPKNNIKRKFEICNVSNINIVGNKPNINNNNNNSGNIIIIINKNENHDTLKNEQILKDNNRISNDDYKMVNYKNNSLSVNNESLINKNEKEALLNKINITKNNPKRKIPKINNSNKKLSPNKNKFINNNNKISINKLNKLYINKAVIIKINNTNINQDLNIDEINNRNPKSEKINNEIKESQDDINLNIDNINDFSINTQLKDERKIEDEQYAKNEIILKEKIEKRKIDSIISNDTTNFENELDESNNQYQEEKKEIENEKEEDANNHQSAKENEVNIRPVSQHNIERQRPVYALPSSQNGPVDENKSLNIINKYYDENFILEDDDEENTLKSIKKIKE